MADKLSDLLAELLGTEELNGTEGKQIAIAKIKEAIFWLNYAYAEKEIKE